jgi:hypothetical protein
MDKYDITLLRRLVIIDELIDSNLNRNNNKIKIFCNTNTLTQFIGYVVEYVKIEIMNTHFKIPLSIIFYDITDEHKELDLKVTDFIKNKYKNKLNEYYHNVNIGLY